MAIINVPRGGQARYIHVQQIINWLRGLPSYSEPVSLTGLTSTSYALTVANSGTGGRALIVKNSSQSVNILTAQDDGVIIKPHSASQSVFRVRNFADNANLFEVSTSGVSIGSEALATDVNVITLQNKTLQSAILKANLVDDYLDIKQQTPALASNPAANRLRLYADVGTDNVKVRTSGGVVSTLVDVENTQTLLQKSLTAPGLETPVITATTNIATRFVNSAANPVNSPVAGSVFIYTVADALRVKDSVGTVKNFATLEGVETFASKTLTSPNLDTALVRDYLKFTLVGSPVATPAGTEGFLWAPTGTTVLRYKLGDSTVREVVDLDSNQNLFNKTLTSPIITAVSLSAPVISNYAEFSWVSNPGGTASKSRLWGDSSGNLYITGPAGTATTILTSTNTSITSSLSFARTLSLGTL